MKLRVRDGEQEQPVDLPAGAVDLLTKQYRQLYKLKAQMQAERVASFGEFIADVREGRFPGPEHVVNASDEVIGAFVEAVNGGG